MSDHPGIKSLPLEIDGVQIRETIREIFRDSANGKPDDITKAGCLALALRSNSMGGPDKGCLVWNAWRDFFTEAPWSNNPMQSGLRLKNTSDFSDLDCVNTHIRIDFSGFKLGCQANFSNSKFGDFHKFKCSIFGTYAIFRQSQFGSLCDFSGSIFHSDAIFENTSWGESANFFGAQIGPRSSFSKSTWQDFVNFLGCQFGKGTKFDNAVFFENCADREGIEFLKDIPSVDFSGLEWSSLKGLYGSTFDDRKNLSEQWGVSPKSFINISFSGVEFFGVTKFVNRQFSSSTSFQRSCFVKSPAFFHGAELHQDTTFEGAKFPLATGSDEATRAYRTLKLAFSKQQAVREEQRFFRLEMEEETLRETGLKRWLFYLYKQFSDYGFSITKPLKYAGFGFLGITALYGVFSWLGQCGLSIQSCRFAPQWLEFSLLQTLPLPGLDKLSDLASKAFWPEGAFWSLVLWFLIILHKAFSLAALFLVGLALRNLFKLK